MATCIECPKELLTIPIPSELKISTMTVISNIYDCDYDINEEINLDILSRLINMCDNDDEKLKTKEGGITSIAYHTNYPRNNMNYKAITTIKSNPFYNQMTVIMENFGFKRSNVKIFNNGKLQMTGILSENEAHHVSKNVINILKNSKIKIYTSVSCLDKIDKKFSNDFAIVYNPKTGKEAYYRYNYLNIIDEIEKNNIVRFFKSDDEKNKFINDHNGWVSDYIIHNFIKNLDDKIKYSTEKLRDINNNLETHLNLKGDKENISSDKSEEEQNDEITQINKKLYDLSKSKSLLTQSLLDLTNISKKCKKIREVDNNVISIISKKFNKDLQTLNDLDTYFDCYEYDIVNNIDAFKLSNIKIELINSDFSTNFMINNTKLYKIVLGKYKAFASYEPNDYPGVKNKFYWNADNIKHNRKQGKCYCEQKCIKKGKKTPCNQITISVFQSGSVIITGAKSIQQIRDAYEYINTIFSENFNEIKGLMTEEDRCKKQEKLNNDRKIMRKKRLFYFKKSDLFDNIDNIDN